MGAICYTAVVVAKTLQINDNKHNVVCMKCSSSILIDMIGCVHLTLVHLKYKGKTCFALVNYIDFVVDANWL